MKRIFIAGLIQETNTFSPVLSDIDFFKRGYILEGDSIIKHLTGTNTEIFGFYNYIQSHCPDIELIPGIAYWAVAGGKLCDAAFETIVKKIVDHMNKSLPVDGILLALHGALVSESCDDCEGHLLQILRRIVGRDIPIVCTFDYHAVITDKILNEADVVIGFRTYPHVDFMRTGIRAAACMVRLLTEGVGELKRFVKKIPMIVPVDNTETDFGPMKEAFRILDTIVSNHGMVSSSIFCPHPWIDTPDMAITVLVYGYSCDVELFTDTVERTARYIWDIKDSFYTEFSCVKDILNGIGSLKKPVLLVDSGDIISAGAIGDSTVILRALIDRSSDLKAVLPVVDPGFFKQSQISGSHKEGWFELGGDSDHGYNRKTRIYAQVVAVDNKPVVVKGESFNGLKLESGKRALLKCGSINIIVFEYPSLMHDPQVLRSIGIGPEKQDVIVQKSHKLFRAAYADIAGTIISVDTPGFTDRNIKRLNYNKIKHPIYPFDDFND